MKYSRYRKLLTHSAVSLYLAGNAVSLLASDAQLSDAVEPWPELLTLEYALSRADTLHPEVRIAKAAVASAHANRADANSGYGVDARLQGRLRWIEPADIALDQTHDDHRVGLIVSKPLYDFGRTSARLDAADAALSGEQYRLQDIINRQRIIIMEAYFNVLLADLGKVRNEEAMSGAFIRSDRVKIRNESGQASDIDVYQLQSEYQQVREQWHQSSALQRSTRGILGNILNRPDDPPVELDDPLLPDNSREIPTDIEPWLQEAEANNPLLRAAQARVTSAQHQVDAARAGDNPLLQGDLEAAAYSREESGHDKWRAGISISIPLLTGGRAQAETGRRRAELDSARATLEVQRRGIRQALLEQWGKLQTLRVARDRARAEVEYRDLYLDRSRTLYEQEVKSDLGDAMTQTSTARLESRRVEFELALTWARIDALLGRTVYDTGDARGDTAVTAPAGIGVLEENEP